MPTELKLHGCLQLRGGPAELPRLARVPQRGPLKRVRLRFLSNLQVVDQAGLPKAGGSEGHQGAG